MGPRWRRPCMRWRWSTGGTDLHRVIEARASPPRGPSTTRVRSIVQIWSIAAMLSREPLSGFKRNRSCFCPRPSVKVSVWRLSCPYALLSVGFLGAWPCCSSLSIFGLEVRKLSISLWNMKRDGLLTALTLCCNMSVPLPFEVIDWGVNLSNLYVFEFGFCTKTRCWIEVPDRNGSRVLSWKVSQKGFIRMVRVEKLFLLSFLDQLIPDQAPSSWLKDQSRSITFQSSLIPETKRTPFSFFYFY